MSSLLRQKNALHCDYHYLVLRKNKNKKNIGYTAIITHLAGYLLPKNANLARESHTSTKTTTIVEGRDLARESHTSTKTTAIVEGRKPWNFYMQISRSTSN
ncbi:hypothetical protein PoB_007147200 [Plakobranchus ocellatus]|uniref:Uncharacterized protein n=1 Tax=Plakobranchus ocellatus TaxID=259542 RepID=A0AAV4DL12_9GAST|nr:hypothetical protein PoB_007147200 [Plakobranchus ocellatus]